MKATRNVSRFVGPLFLSVFLAARPAHADPATAEDTAAQLFEQAKGLMDQNRYAEACSVLDRSQSLDPQLGTMLNQAYCYENLGKMATAWSLWLDAAAAAEARGERDREAFARARAADLEPRLPHVVVTVTPQRDVENLDVRIDGRPLPRIQWGAPTPIDPGLHRIQARAVGRQPYAQDVDVTSGDVPPVTVPVLVDLPVDPKAAGPAEKETHAQVRHWQRPAGLAIGVIGLGVLGGGGVLAGVAKSGYDATAGACGTVVCNPDGAQPRKNAIAEANVATAAFVVGGAALVGGVVLWLSAPKDTSDLRVQATVTASGLRLLGEW
jgi:hypothetical protein